ncbi:beta-lactamase family protein [Crossiella sp. SN42]|uniref:serine hydrolase domain-containing protein n=1 Tax=Crossiella sp. SN42 TaxID=2944808 RepID=UPI00207C6C80|nr:serine hydrolase domain-containing protein [Crossiella sp. SN42]MCO1579216.1 beta-lactamase family protein [Crossiella sp. SN42]
MRSQITLGVGVTQIHGTVAPGFEPVRDAFAANFSTGGDIGAAVTVYRRGEKIVDLWGGVADVDTGREWRQDTLQLVFSTTKGVTATVAHLLVQRGELDLDAPVAKYWPEFAAEGKQDIPVRWLLSHQAGLAVPPERFPLSWLREWDPIVEMLAAQAPNWEPGTAHGYHGLTYGWLVGEVIRRATGRTIGAVLAEEVAKPLNLDLWIGLPEEQEPRVAKFIDPDPMPEPTPGQELPPEIAKMQAAFSDLNSMTMRALIVTTEPIPANSRDLRAAEVPAVGAVGTADSFAKLYASTVGEVDGFRLLTPETVDRARTVQTIGPDQLLQLPTAWALGYISGQPAPGVVPTMALLGPDSFGHGGYGGSLAFGDVHHEIGFGYVMNKIHSGLTGEGANSARLVNALRSSLAG